MFLQILISLLVDVAESHGTATSIITVFCSFSITTMSAWLAGTSLSVWISRSHRPLAMLFSTGTGSLWPWWYIYLYIYNIVQLIQLIQRSFSDSVSQSAYQIDCNRKRCVGKWMEENMACEKKKESWHRNRTFNSKLTDKYMFILICCKTDTDVDQKREC